MYLNIVFSEMTWLFKLKFHMEYSFDCLGHLTKMAATHIYGKTKYVPKISLS